MQETIMELTLISTRKPMIFSPNLLMEKKESIVMTVHPLPCEQEEEQRSLSRSSKSGKSSKRINLEFNRRKQRYRVAGSRERLNDRRRTRPKSQKIQAVPSPTAKVKYSRKASQC
jgi:predicted Zn-dependent protease